MFVKTKPAFQRSAVSITLSREEAMALIHDVSRAATRGQQIRVVVWRPGFKDSKGRVWKGRQITALAMRKPSK
jgi:hypothetical protein